MSISGTLSAAMSGLVAAARASEVVASNIANAGTEGYGRRDLELVARTIGATGNGVSIVGVTRHVDRALLSDRRSAEAAAAGTAVRAGFLDRLEAGIGLPGAPGSLATRIGGLEAALTAAAARPGADAALGSVLDAAKGLADQITGLSDIVQTSRLTADRAIASDVMRLNAALQEVAAMNNQIHRTVAAGRDGSALMDRRQQALDRVAAILPIGEVERDNGRIAVVASHGTILADREAAVFGFDPAAVIAPGMTLAGGALSGLTLNGREIAPEGVVAGGGRLAAQFALRDDLAPRAQALLDALAADLVARTAAPGTDPTLAPGAAGLFLDPGEAGSPGLAARLRVNPAADPAAGGALWRLRDGLGAATPGAAGNGRVLGALASALEGLREPAAAGFTPGARSFAGLAADVLSAVAVDRLREQSGADFAAARHAALQQMERDGGVDTDHELQRLLMIERAYGANARVIQAVDRMLDRLMEI